MGKQYTKDEIRKNIYVPAKVVEELQGIAEDHLKKCGLFYRIFSRVKTPSSLEHKYQFKEYGEDDKKIQDLIGIRIILYFQDDLKLCEELLEKCFQIVSWTQSKEDTITFAPTKFNGVFNLPDYLANEISDETWSMSIDKTFEVQIKTIFFEGWHEVEHDMRYKNAAIWEKQQGASRRLNSILATLELCDDSMTRTFENLAHDLYKKNDIENMARMHFRLKMKNTEMYDELLPILLEKEKKYAKKLFKCDRGVVVNRLLIQRVPVPININTIIAMVNDEVWKDERIYAIMKEHNVYHDGKERPEKRDSQASSLQMLTEKVIFQGKVEILSNYPNSDVIRDEDSKTKVLDTDGCNENESIYKELKRILYSWLSEKFKDVFAGLSDQPAILSFHTIGYEADFTFSDTEHTIQMETKHISQTDVGRIYITSASVYEKDGKLWLEVKNAYKDNVSKRAQIREFSYPVFYREICDHEGWIVRDVDILKNGALQIESEEQVIKLKEFFSSSNRIYPAVCIVTGDGEGNGPALDWIKHLVKFSWRFSHIYFCDLDMEQELFSCHEGRAEVGGIHIIPAVDANQKKQYYSWDMAEDSKYNWRLGYEKHNLLNNILSGEEAFNHQMIHEIKKCLLQGDAK